MAAIGRASTVRPNGRRGGPSLVALAIALAMPAGAAGAEEIVVKAETNASVKVSAKWNSDRRSQRGPRSALAL